ncbi:hypothetical protein [Kitasatospora sp. NPDC058218]|uniref:hypothetical protein n=1 Tax=Kitasatospora sp. NPDC058218 TaxID=3346385 RepID=UPI0036DB04DF
MPGLAAERRGRLADLLDATSPQTRARQVQATVLPVLEPLRALLPHGGLAKGTVTEAADMSLLLALAAGPATADCYAWTAAVGLPSLGLAAAAGSGVTTRYAPPTLDSPLRPEVQPADGRPQSPDAPSQVGAPGVG